MYGRNKNKLEFNSSRGRIRWSAFKLYKHVNNDDHDDHDDDDLDSNGDDNDDDDHDYVDDYHQQTMMTSD